MCRSVHGHIKCSRIMNKTIWIPIRKTQASCTEATGLYGIPMTNQRIQFREQAGSVGNSLAESCKITAGKHLGSIGFPHQSHTLLQHLHTYFRTTRFFGKPIGFLCKTVSVKQQDFTGFPLRSPVARIPKLHDSI